MLHAVIGIQIIIIIISSGSRVKFAIKHSFPLRRTVVKISCHAGPNVLSAARSLLCWGTLEATRVLIV
jgi:hypothetical protein